MNFLSRLKVSGFHQFLFDFNIFLYANFQIPTSKINNRVKDFQAIKICQNCSDKHWYIFKEEQKNGIKVQIVERNGKKIQS